MKARTTLVYISIVITLLSTVLALSCAKPTNEALVVYVYDSFASEWGLGPVVLPAFEKETGIKVQLVSAGDAGQVLARAIDEKAAPKADVLLGIDNLLLPKAVAADILEPYKPNRAGLVPAELVPDALWRITPFDWGSFAIIWDSEKLGEPPVSLEALTKPEYERKLILMDPRTSSPGYGFLAWTKAVYGEGLADYWQRLAPSILTMSPGWDTGYGLFTAGEAPLVISYTTSPAYHAEYETPGRYRALIFPEGHPVQIEGAGIIKGSKHVKQARAFIDFLLSDTFQQAVPLSNWMYPILPDTPLPPSFDYAPKPDKNLLIDPSTLEGADRQALDALK
ncbi:MAG: thiamine ABC transporter substrate-binding protein [Spirochaetales bacterium]|nr:MAG: thiamine ABC transporter substrate-binding protein [Spirochaetales bacterium]